ncbi:MAG: FixH protein [Polaromonas sp.]|nr:FixH protein [Polaromonas sp.]
MKSSDPATHLSPQSHGLVRPWWKEPYVWMVIGGPASAVIACAITAVYILSGPEAVVSENYYKEGLALGRAVATAKPAMEPAVIGRNHSATGGKNNERP